MRKLTILPVTFALLVAAPQIGSALVLSHALTTYTAPPDVLFDSGLGMLTSVTLDFKFRTSVVYDLSVNEMYAPMHPFNIEFYGDAPFHVENDLSSRDTVFPWTMPGHCDGGPGASYYFGYGNGSVVQTHTSQGVLDFFTARQGDQSLTVFPNWTDGVICSPEVVYDDAFNRYDAYGSHVEFGDGLVITYNYEALTPVPEAASSLLLGAAAIAWLSLRLRTGMRRRTA